MNKIMVSVMLLIVFPFSYAAEIFGVNFYDEANFLSNYKQHLPMHMYHAPRLANQYFDIMRTITDFNEGDPNQRVCSCYQIGNNIFNKRQCSFQKGVVQTENLKVILTIENPEKWLSTKEKAIAYIYQNVLPLQQGATHPEQESLQPYFWGTVPQTMVEAGCNLNTTQNHILAIVVGLEVGTHVNPNSHDFAHKSQQVSHLNLYVMNLIAALNEFGLKQSIYVTTSIAPSNCDLSVSHCGNVLEFLTLIHNEYNLNVSDYTINNVRVNFSQTYEALKTINAQEYSGSHLGVLLSLYHYWQYFPGENLGDYDLNKWKSEIEIRHEMIVDAVQNNQGLQNLALSIGEIGWPSAGNNSCDGSPNSPSLSTQTKLLQATYDWRLNDPDNIAPIVLFWRLFQIDSDAALIMNCNEHNPEFYYGLLPGELENLYTTHNITPNAGINFPDFKGASGSTDDTPIMMDDDVVVIIPPVIDETEEDVIDTPDESSVSIIHCPETQPNGGFGWLMDNSNEPIAQSGYQYMIIEVSGEDSISGQKNYGQHNELFEVESGIADDGNYPKLICKYNNDNGTNSYYISAGHDQDNSCSVGFNGFFKGENCKPKPWG